MNIKKSCDVLVEAAVLRLSISAWWTMNSYDILNQIADCRIEYINKMGYDVLVQTGVSKKKSA